MIQWLRNLLNECVLDEHDVEVDVARAASYPSGQYARKDAPAEDWAGLRSRIPA